MRLNAHATGSSAPLSPARQGSRGRVGLPTFFAGMTRTARWALDEALTEPGGLILLAGPPGSGRATTLRGLFRARPDALVIGDIGSPERAAAAHLTARGRLVFATINAADAIGALRQIASFGVEPFSIACVLRLVIAQRLVHRLCPSCRVPMQPPNSITGLLGLEPGAVVYRAQGCGTCDGNGFAGPMGVFETLPVDANVGRLIVCGAEEAAIANHVFRTWPNLAAAACALAVQGFTTAEEAIELLRPQRQ